MLWGGRNTANNYHWHVWRVLTVSGPHWVCPHLWHVCFPSLHHSSSRLLCRALGCMHVPGLSHSDLGSRIFHKGTDSAGPVFCALPRSKQLRRLDAWQVHSPQVGSASYHLPGSSHSVSWMCSGSAFSGVLRVSSGELISDCDPPSGCQLSRIPGRLG